MLGVVVGEDVVRHFAHAAPAEVGLHLVLVSPLVRESPDGIVVVVHEGLAVEHALFLVVVEAHSESALEHVVGVVGVGHGTVAWYAVVLFEAEVAVFPLYERVEHVHELAVSEALAVAGEAVLRESVAGPYGVNLLAEYVHADVLCVFAEGLHLLVRLFGREVSVHLSVDEVHLDVGHRLGVVGIVADVGQCIVVEGVAYDVESVAEHVGVVYGVSSVEVSSVVSFVPCGADELYAVVFRNSGNHHGLFALGDVDAGDACPLVVVFSGSVPEVGECGDGSVALVVGHAVFGVVGAFEELVGECLDEGAFEGIDVFLGDAFAEGGVEVIAEDGVFVHALLVTLHELHFGA